MQALILKQFSEGIGLTGMDQMSITAPSSARSSDKESEEEEKEEEKEDKKLSKKKGGNKKDGHVLKTTKNVKAGKGGQEGKGKDKGKGKGKGKPAEIEMKMHLHKKNLDVASKRREIVEAIDVMKGNKLAVALRRDSIAGGRDGWDGTGRMNE